MGVVPGWLCYPRELAIKLLVSPSINKVDRNDIKFLNIITPEASHLYNNITTEQNLAPISSCIDVLSIHSTTVALAIY